PALPERALSRRTLPSTNLFHHVIQKVRAVDSIDHERFAGPVEETLPVCVFQKLRLLFRIELTPRLAFGDGLCIVVSITGCLCPQGFAHVVGSTMLKLPDVSHLVDQDRRVVLKGVLLEMDDVTMCSVSSDREQVIALLDPDAGVVDAVAIDLLQFGNLLIG